MLRCRPNTPDPGAGRITFAHPTTQQQLLVWRERPRTALVIKKLGKELKRQFFEVGEPRTHVCTV